jgi:hypothetical protein
MPTNKTKILLNTLFWGFILWLIGYVLGIIFFALVPPAMIGWYIMPLGVLITLWVLVKKIKRESFGCYFGLGLVWAVMAIILDYFFIVKLFQSADYYKADVFVYYALTFILPLLIGWFKMKKPLTNHQN